MHHGIYADGIGRTAVDGLGPGVPIRIRKASVIRGGAVGPLRIPRAGKMREKGLGFRVVDALAAPAGDPDVGCHAILVCGLGGIGASGFAKADQRAGPHCWRGRKAGRGQLR